MGPNSAARRRSMLEIPVHAADFPCSGRRIRVSGMLDNMR